MSRWRDTRSPRRICRSLERAAVSRAYEGSRQCVSAIRVAGIGRSKYDVSRENTIRDDADRSDDTERSCL